MINTLNNNIGLAFGCLGILLACGCQTVDVDSTDSALSQPIGYPEMSLDDWREPHGEWFQAQGISLDTANPSRLLSSTGTGTLVNGPRGNTINLLTRDMHGDARVHIEFLIPQGSNSGVYFQGRYEIQIFDSWGEFEPQFSDCGGIYERGDGGSGFDGHAPRINASLPPGEWQSFDVIFRAPRFDEHSEKTENARFIRVIHNGVTIHEDVELTGPTRAAAFDWDEKPIGPLMLQGDHGPVAFRNLRIEKINLN